MASVRSGSIQQAAGWTVGEFFTGILDDVASTYILLGNGVPGDILRVSADGTTVTNPWVSLGNSICFDFFFSPENFFPPIKTKPYFLGSDFGLLRGALAFDTTGVYNGDLLVVGEPGSVWRVNNLGQATQLFTVPQSLRASVDSGCPAWRIQ